jgi:hypothetical protein
LIGIVEVLTTDSSITPGSIIRPSDTPGYVTATLPDPASAVLIQDIGYTIQPVKSKKVKIVLREVQPLA